MYYYLFFRKVRLILIQLEICKSLLLMATLWKFLLHLLISLKRLTKLVFGNMSMRAALHTKMRRRKRVQSKIGNRFLNQQFIHVSYFRCMLPFWLLWWHVVKSTNYAPSHREKCLCPHVSSFMSGPYVDLSMLFPEWVQNCINWKASYKRLGFS